MKSVILKEKNRETIEQELENVQRRCTARLINYNCIDSMSKKLKKYYGLSNKDLNGCKFIIDLHAQTFPSAYKYTPNSTKIILEFKNSYWKIIDIFRAETNRENGVVEAHLTEQAQKTIIEHFTYPF